MLGYDVRAEHYGLLYEIVDTSRQPQLRPDGTEAAGGGQRSQGTFTRIAADRSDDPMARSTSAVALLALAPQDFDNLAKTVVADVTTVRHGWRRIAGPAGCALTTAPGMLRAVEAHDRTRAWFGMRVGYNSSIVNQHGVELYLVDQGLRIEKTWARIPWEVEEVATALVSERR
jgi:hypothetical protein